MVRVILSLAALMMVIALPALAADEPGKSATTRPIPDLPHLRVNRDKGTVEIESKVIRREADWLELLVCTPGTREHESILTTPARPSHIHLALLLLGAEPGQPMKWSYEGEKPVVTPPSGPKVRVQLRYRQDDKDQTVPANQWVLHRPTGKKLPDDIWLFTGSGMVDWEGQRHYRADVNGTILSLVNFGDDLLARSTSVTSQNDDAAWGASSDDIPAVGTAVTIILSPVKAEPGVKP